MLYLKLDKAKAEAKATEEKRRKTRAAHVPTGAEGPAWQAATPQPPVVTHSKWLGLSAEEQLAWANSTQDPRIAVGSYSPLEKKIKRLGGTNSSRVRKLLIQEFQQENETLDKLKAKSFDFQFAKTDTYYYQQYKEMMNQAWSYEMNPECEINIQEEKCSQSKKPKDDKKWDYVVTERELNHIEKHIHRAERARGLRDHKYQLLPQKVPSEILFPKSLTMEDKKNEKIQKTATKKPKVAWAKEQMKRHKERMVRGRELTEQRNDQREAQKIPSHVRPLLKPQARKKGKVKELDKVPAYPIFQPSKDSLIQVTILTEKAHEDKIQKPLRRELLSIPPFLRSQLGKKKFKLFS